MKNKLKEVFNRFTGRAVVQKAKADDVQKHIDTNRQRVIQCAGELFQLLRPGATEVIHLNAGKVLLPGQSQLPQSGFIIISKSVAIENLQVNIQHSTEKP